MLKAIRIRRFAIIETLDLEFGTGFNVFTGETGAGKSIILDALSILLGEKADNSFIREGERRASIEAVFDISSRRDEIMPILEREDLLSDDDPDELMLTRELRLEGRSTARINGRSVNLGILQEIGSLLVDIHGQSEHLSLLKPVTHIHLVDQFAQNRDLLKQYRAVYRKYLAAVKELKTLRESEAQALRQQDILTYQLNEISAAELSPEEEKSLLQDRDRIANAEKIARQLHQALSALLGRSDEHPGVIEQLGDLDTALEALSSWDPTLQPLYDSLITSFDQINEILDKLQHYKSQLGFSARKRNQVEERLNVYYTLKRKYGGTVEAVLAFAKDAERQLSLITNAGERITALQEEQKVLLDQLTVLARELSERRKEAGEKIARQVEKELSDLRMQKARFQIQIDPQELSENGMDQVQFLIAPNPGEGLKPLAKIASGGETSRLMLALKNTLAQADPVPTLVFDEIDQGIGGPVGTLVGEKLWQLSGWHQVICITHLPQLAALRDTHYHVRKQIHDDRTQSVVIPLDEEQSLLELASMLGSESSENIQAARAMLTHAAEFKSERSAERN